MKCESCLEDLVESERLEIKGRKEIINYGNFLKKSEELGGSGNVQGLDLETKRNHPITISSEQNKQRKQKDADG